MYIEPRTDSREMVVRLTEEHCESSEPVTSV